MDKHRYYPEEYDISTRRRERRFMCHSGCDECFIEYKYDKTTLWVREYALEGYLGYPDRIDLRILWWCQWYAHAFAQGRV